MKVILVLAALLGLATQAQADTIEYRCPQNLYFSPLKPGATSKTVMEVYTTTNPKHNIVRIFDQVLATGRKTLVREELVSISTEDVMYWMRGRGLFVTIYLDELDQSAVKLGKETTHVHCRPVRQRR